MVSCQFSLSNRAKGCHLVLLSEFCEDPPNKVRRRRWASSPTQSPLLTEKWGSCECRARDFRAASTLNRAIHLRVPDAQILFWVTDAALRKQSKSISSPNGIDPSHPKSRNEHTRAPYRQRHQVCPAVRGAQGGEGEQKWLPGPSGGGNRAEQGSSGEATEHQKGRRTNKEDVGCSATPASPLPAAWEPEGWLGNHWSRTPASSRAHGLSCLLDRSLPVGRLPWASLPPPISFQ